MSWETKLLRLMLLAHTLAAAAAASLLVRQGGAGPRIFIALTFSLACCQINLSTAWAVLAPQPWLWRLTWIGTPLACWCCVHGCVHISLLHWLAVFSPIAAGTALCGMLARIVSGRGFELVERGALTDHAKRPLEQHQYSLRTLILGITAAALGCGMARLFAETWLHFANDLVVYSAAAMLTDAGLLYGWFRARRGGMLRIALLLIVAITAYALRGFAQPTPEGFNSLVTFFHVTLSAATLQVMRVAGVRLTVGGTTNFRPLVQESGTEGSAPH